MFLSFVNIISLFEWCEIKYKKGDIVVLNVTHLAIAGVLSLWQLEC